MKGIPQGRCTREFREEREYVIAEGCAELVIADIDIGELVEIRMERDLD